VIDVRWIPKWYRNWWVPGSWPGFSRPNDPMNSISSPADPGDTELIQDLLAACGAALARIESDIESPNTKTNEGNLLRAVIAKAAQRSRDFS
jgi:hypothetical protein